MAHPENKEAKPITPRSGRVGNFLVNEEIIEIDGAEPLSRMHVSDVEHGWEVVIPQTYASAYNIVSLAVDEEMNDKETEQILHFIFDNFFLATTCLQGEYQSLLRDVAALGFMPAVNKKTVKDRKMLRKIIDNKLRGFEFKGFEPEMDEDEERQAEIAEEARDILELGSEQDKEE